MPNILALDNDLKYKYISNGKFISDCLLSETNFDRLCTDLLNYLVIQIMGYDQDPTHQVLLPGLSKISSEEVDSRSSMICTE